jgi:TRAP-type transport system small permease protein
MDRLNKIKDILIQAETKITLFLLMLLLIIVVVEVILRYLRLPLYWSEEISRYLFIWMVMFGCIIGVELKTHFNVDIIIRSVKERYKRVAFIISNLVAIVFLSYMLYEGIILCIKTQRATSPALGMPQYYAYLAIPIAAFLMLIHLFIQIYEKLFFERNVS